MIHEKGDTLNDATAITPRINKTVDRRMPTLNNYKKKQYIYTAQTYHMTENNASLST